MRKEYDEQFEALNELLLDMVKTQKDYIKNIIKIFIFTMMCYTLILISGVVGFFVYEGQFEVSEEASTVTETTIEQEVSGDSAEINNVKGNMYKDDAIHNE